MYVSYDLNRKILQNASQFQMEIDISNCHASSFENPSHKLLGYGFLQDQCYVMNLFFTPLYQIQRNILLGAKHPPRLSQFSCARFRHFVHLEP